MQVYKKMCYPSAVEFNIQLFCDSHNTAERLQSGADGNVEWKQYQQQQLQSENQQIACKGILKTMRNHARNTPSWYCNYKSLKKLDGLVAQLAAEEDSREKCLELQKIHQCLSQQMAKIVQEAKKAKHDEYSKKSEKNVDVKASSKASKTIWSKLKKPFTIKRNPQNPHKMPMPLQKHKVYTDEVLNKSKGHIFCFNSQASGINVQSQAASSKPAKKNAAKKRSLTKQKEDEISNKSKSSLKKDASSHSNVTERKPNQKCNCDCLSILQKLLEEHHQDDSNSTKLGKSCTKIPAESSHSFSEAKIRRKKTRERMMSKRPKHASRSQSRRSIRSAAETSKCCKIKHTESVMQDIYQRLSKILAKNKTFDSAFRCRCRKELAARRANSKSVREKSNENRKTSKHDSRKSRQHTHSRSRQSSRKRQLKDYSIESLEHFAREYIQRSLLLKCKPKGKRAHKSSSDSSSDSSFTSLQSSSSDEEIIRKKPKTADTSKYKKKPIADNCCCSDNASSASSFSAASFSNRNYKQNRIGTYTKKCPTSKFAQKPDKNNQKQMNLSRNQQSVGSEREASTDSYRYKGNSYRPTETKNRKSIAAHASKDSNFAKNAVASVRSTRRTSNSFSECSCDSKDDRHSNAARDDRQSNAARDYRKANQNRISFDNNDRPARVGIFDGPSQINPKKCAPSKIAIKLNINNKSQMNLSRNEQRKDSNFSKSAASVRISNSIDSYSNTNEKNNSRPAKCNNATCPFYSARPAQCNNATCPFYSAANSGDSSIIAAKAAQNNARPAKCNNATCPFYSTANSRDSSIIAAKAAQNNTRPAQCNNATCPFYSAANSRDSSIIAAKAAQNNGARYSQNDRHSKAARDSKDDRHSNADRDPKDDRHSNAAQDLKNVRNSKQNRISFDNNERPARASIFSPTSQINPKKCAPSKFATRPDMMNQNEMNLSKNQQRNRKSIAAKNSAASVRIANGSSGIIESYSNPNKINSSRPAKCNNATCPFYNSAAPSRDSSFIAQNNARPAKCNKATCRFYNSAETSRDSKAARNNATSYESKDPKRQPVKRISSGADNCWPQTLHTYANNFIESRTNEPFRKATSKRKPLLREIWRNPDQKMNYPSSANKL